MNAASFEHVAIRPEHMRLADAGDAIQLPATVRDRVYLGSKSRLLLETRAGEELMLYFDNGGALQAPEPGADIRVTWETGDSFAL